MSIFDWQDAYRIDEGMIDAQHKNLLKIAEKLFNAVLARRDEDHLESCFAELLNYTQKHFNEEEAYFERLKTSGLAQHCEEHNVLAKELQKTWDAEKLGFQEEPGRLLLNWVEERLLPHMMIEDQEVYSSKGQ
ncbi:hemerythrin family protein [Terasakiella sp. SH-1]|uniref:bacteriohemerythrin n=1 Tax=Terasakiella sp. SH-1 TaxID=2560057 RepID=UPI0010742888|nr:hemerythrin family protein [Terasakiella sp. SH-1]